MFTSDAARPLSFVDAPLDELGLHLYGRKIIASRSCNQEKKEHTRSFTTRACYVTGPRRSETHKAFTTALCCDVSTFVRYARTLDPVGMSVGDKHTLSGWEPPDNAVSSAWASHWIRTLGSAGIGYTHDDLWFGIIDALARLVFASRC